MRRVSSLLVLGLVSLLVGPLAADKVVLRDGRTLDTKKPPEIRGRQVVLTLADGRLVSVPASEIDREKTAMLATKAAEAALAPPVPAPTAVRPPTLAGAAEASRSARKATVVLTDQDVARGYLEPQLEETGEKTGRVVVGPLSGTRNETGYTVEGSVQNVGATTVDGVVVAVEVVGAEGKAVSSSFGQLAKDTLAPGETTTFVARIETPQLAEGFRGVARWLSRPAPVEENEPGREGERESTPESTSEAPSEVAPPPAPEPAPEPTPPPRQPDYAAPPANAPVGSPETPGGTYLPPPSSDQPKPPGGGS